MNVVLNPEDILSAELCVEVLNPLRKSISPRLRSRQADDIPRSSHLFC